MKNLIRKYVKNDILYSLCCTLKLSLLAQVLWGGPWLSKTGICSRQDAKNAKSGSLISLRPLRLCARYSEFWLRLRRARFSAIILVDLIVIIDIRFRIQFLSRYAIPFFGPRSKIDELAAIGTERSIGIIFPLRFAVTGGALDPKRHSFLFSCPKSSQRKARQLRVFSP
jgi:hypothetical protein